MEYYFWFVLAIFGGAITFISIGRMLSDSIWNSDLSDFFALVVGATVCFIVATAAPNLDFIAAQSNSVVVFTYTNMWFFAFPFMAMALVDGLFSLIALISFLRMRRVSRGY